MSPAYTLLCWLTGLVFVVSGAAMFGISLVSFAPSAPQLLPFPMGPQSYYFLASTGAALLAWGGCLIAAGRGLGARPIGTASALGLVLLAVYRILAWFMADFAWAGELLRVEAGVFLVLALALLWLRPPARAPRIL